jgi:hypothetical protein
MLSAPRLSVASAFRHSTANKDGARAEAFTIVNRRHDTAPSSTSVVSTTRRHMTTYTAVPSHSFSQLGISLFSRACGLTSYQQNMFSSRVTPFDESEIST